MRVCYDIVSIDKIPENLLVKLPMNRVCRALQCPKTLNSRLEIDGEDVDAWFQDQGISENHWILIRNYQLGTYRDNPVIKFDHAEHAVLFALRWC